MKLAYVAGPFRGPNAWEIECNIRRAEELALQIWRMGIPVVCPHTNTRFFQGAADDKIWLDGDIEILRRCDMVFLTADWMRSSGARAEVKVALDLGLPLYVAPNLTWRLNPAWVRLAIEDFEAGRSVQTPPPPSE